ncbi:insulinase family protein [Helicobacter cinaedi]|uniref:Zinc protease n=1 Tax=Helicobacter cinaedi CCUG 18818 = ATCC BAA-847 TaxID=537971 RepID=A0AAI8MNB7_9HELI|nr:pitrilysin family protein [Helicobacter cinaedi]QOQ91507.1 insulinase family protein [Helicobacter cinaedi]BAM32449.1 putative zinc protease [Helicobacter cinaedi CCUG 18818 = ATCC BAA-847]
MSVVTSINSAFSTQSVLPKHYTKMLENGLEIVVVPLHNQSGVIETNVFYKVGSRNESMGKSGIAHMLEHLSFKSTKNLRAGEFDEIVKGFGGVNNASTSFDYTRYFIKSSAENMDKSLELFAELMSNLALEDSEFQPERNVVAEERLWRTDNSPMGYLYFRFFNTAYVYHPYHWTPIGFMEDIKAWKIEDIRAFYETYYQPQNAIVLVSGDIEPNVVFESATKHFGALKNRTDSIPQVVAKEPKQDGERRVIVKKDSQVEYLTMGYKIPNYLSKDQVALSAIGEILSSGKSSIFQTELIDRQQIATSAYAYNMDLKDESVFLIVAAARQGVSAESVEKEIYTILDRLKKGEISQEELEKVKINTRASFIYSLESAGDVAGLFGSYLVRGDISPLLRYEREINTLSIEKIKEVANTYFTQDSLSVVILKDTK